MIEVSGRLYPVEIRWRPFEESRDHDLGDAICDAVDELWRGPGAAGSGDVLVFLPGEREIRDAAERAAQAPPARRRSAAALRAALGQQQQDEVFAPHSARRIVLATNVAETSLTVPGIRYVIDAGTGAHQALQLSQQGRAAADRADQPGGGEPARRPLRPRRRRHLHPPLRRGRLRGATAASPIRRSCARRSPA